MYLPVLKQAIRKYRPDSSGFPNSQGKTKSKTQNKPHHHRTKNTVHNLFPHCMLSYNFPWYISCFCFTVTTITDRINIKEESYMWGSHFQRDSGCHGGGGTKGQLTCGGWKYSIDPLTRSWLGNRAREMETGPRAWLQPLEAHPQGPASAS